MAAFGVVTINDGASTPVAHSFNPVKITDGVTADWRESQASLPVVGQGTLRVSVRELKSGVMQVNVAVATPALETATGANASGYTAAPKVAHVPMGSMTFNFDKRTTVQQRKDIRSFMVNALQHATIIDAVDNLNATY